MIFKQMIIVARLKRQLPIALFSNVFCFAFKYENQVYMLGSWTSKGCPRPAFSNAKGDVSLYTVKIAFMNSNVDEFEDFVLLINLFYVSIAGFTEVLF